MFVTIFTLPWIIQSNYLWQISRQNLNCSIHLQFVFVYWLRSKRCSNIKWQFFGVLTSELCSIRLRYQWINITLCLWWTTWHAVPFVGVRFPCLGYESAHIEFHDSLIWLWSINYFYLDGYTLVVITIISLAANQEAGSRRTRRPQPISEKVTWMPPRFSCVDCAGW